MSTLSYIALRADVINNIFDNEDELVTGQKEQDRLLNIIDSTSNVITGGNVYQSLLGYSSELNLTDRKNFAYRGWVEDYVTANAPNLTPYFKADGTVAMTGHANWGGKNITNFGTLYSGNTNVIVNSTNANNYLQIASGGVVLNSNGEVTVQSTALNLTTGDYKASLKSDLLSDNRTIQFQDIDYTGVADISDINSTNILTAIGDGSKINSSYLPSYVDDILEFSNFASFPLTGETGKIYIDDSTNFQYRWSGSAYIQITSSSAVWGSISGSLSSQTDLQSALNSKQDLILGGTYTPGAGTVSSSDSVKSAIQKLDGNIQAGLLTQQQQYTLTMSLLNSI